MPHKMTNSTYQTKDKTQVTSIFNAIAPSYDFSNRTLSMGIDIYWRKQLIKRLVKTSEDMKLLDVATGTADLALAFCQKHSCIKAAIGVDLANNMLEIGRQKIKHNHLESIIDLQTGDATNLDFADATFDVVSISFGIRNVENLEKALSEMSRVLKPGGQLLILEFSLPSNIVLRTLYLMYFRHILPTLGRLFSKHPQAYAYLNKTVESFPYGQKFADIIKLQGFAELNFRPLTFGIATVYEGKKALSFRAEREI